MNRYAQMAKTMAAASYEKDLLKVSENCAYLSERSASTFYQVVQSILQYTMAMAYE